MECLGCNGMNDDDARFCVQCGNVISTGPKIPLVRSRRVYLFALLLVPVLALVAAVGYYKYFLPDGVAAVVNGEEIRCSELNTVMSPALARQESAAGRRLTESETAKLRYETLYRMIADRLAQQKARNAGTGASAAAVVRIALDEQWPASGCGCCNKNRVK